MCRGGSPRAYCANVARCVADPDTHVLSVIFCHSLRAARAVHRAAVKFITELRGVRWSDAPLETPAHDLLWNGRKLESCALRFEERILAEFGNELQSVYPDAMNVCAALAEYAHQRARVRQLTLRQAERFVRAVASRIATGASETAERDSIAEYMLSSVFRNIGLCPTEAQGFIY
jgi:hypothetical protein